MNIITIPVENLRIKTPFKNVIHKGSRNNTRLQFQFSKEWKKFTKKAIGFYHNPEEGGEWFPLGNNGIILPDDYRDKTFYIQIAGQWGSTRITTGLSSVRVGGE